MDNVFYSNICRFFDYEMLLIDVVRIEEMINYFSYDYLLLKGLYFFSLIIEVVIVLWN